MFTLCRQAVCLVEQAEVSVGDKLAINLHVSSTSWHYIQAECKKLL